MTKERAELAAGIAQWVGLELWCHYGIEQDCIHDPETDRLVLPATAGRPQVTLALPLALHLVRIREYVDDAMSSYISWLPHEMRP